MRIDVYLILDIFCFLLFPLVFWEAGRALTGDYAAMLISSLPGILYGGLRFFHQKNISFTALYLMFNIIAGTIVDLSSGSALQLLWNGIYYEIALAALYLTFSLTGKSLFLYFCLDLLVMQGNDKKITKEILSEKANLKVFNLISFFYSGIQILYAGLMVYAIRFQGVHAFKTSIFIEQAANVLMAIASILGMIYINGQLDEIAFVQKIGRKKISRTGLKSREWYRVHLESSYFFFSSQNR